MANKSSELALNEILDILDFTIAQQLENKKSLQDFPQVDLNLLALIQGIISVTEESNTGAGDQVKSLAQGLDVLKTINTKDMKNVSASLFSLGASLNSLILKDEAIESLNTIIKFLTAAGMLSNMDPNNANVLNSLASTLNEKDIEIINNVFSLMNNIVLKDSTIDSFYSIIKFLNTTSIDPKNNVLRLIASAVTKKQLESLNELVNVLNNFVLKEEVLDSFNTLIRLLNLQDINKDNNIIHALTSELNEKDIESLNSIINSLNLSNIDVNKLEMFELLTQYLADASKHLTDFINNIELKDEKKTLATTIAINKITAAFALIVGINIKVLNENLKKLDVNAGKLLGLFLSSIIRNIPNERLTSKMLYSLGNFMNGIVAIVNANVFKMKISMNPLKGYLLGRLIGTFLKAILKAIPEKEIKLDFKGIGELMTSLVAFADKNSKVSMWKLKRTLTPKNGKAIGLFFVKLVKGIPTSKEASETYKSISEITKSLGKLNLATAIGIKFFTTLVTEKEAKKLNKFMKELCKGVKKNELEQVNHTMKILPKVLLSLIACVALMTLTVVAFGLGNVILGLLILSTAVTGFYFLIKKLAKIKNKDLLNTAKAVISLAKAVLLITASLALVTLLAIQFDVKDIIIGMGLILLYTAAMVGILAILGSDYFKKSISNAVKSLTGMAYAVLLLTASLTLITLNILLLSYTIEKFDYDKVITAAIITLAFMGMMLLMFKAIQNLKKDIIVAALAMLLISASIALIALTMELLMIPIGKKLGAALKGAAAVLLFAAMSILLIKELNWAAGKNKKNLLDAVIAMAGLVLIMGAIALITNELLIPIGYEWGSAAKGSIVVLGIVAVLGLMVYELGKITQDKKTLVNSILGIAALALIMLGVSLITKELLIPIGEQAKEALYGAGIVLGLIAAFGGIVFAIAKFVDDKMMLQMAKAEALLAGLALAIAACMLPAKLFVEIGQLVSSLQEGAITTTGLLVAGIIGAGVLMVAAIFALMTVLAPFGGPVAIAIAEALLAGLGLAITACMLPAEKFIELAQKVSGFGEGELSLASLSIVGIFGALGLIAAEIAIAGPAFIIASAMLPAVGLAILGLNALIDSCVKLFKKTNETINADIIQNVTELITGKNGLMSSIAKIVEAIWDLPFLKIMNVATKLTPLDALFDTISHFIDLIVKVASMNYISGYDDRGKPIFSRIPPDTFKRSAEVVTAGFTNFIGQLATKLGDIKKLSTGAILSFNTAIRPLMNTISKFVDIVIKVATMNVVTGYDANGKPIYEKVDPTVFTSAATAVSTSFGTFITKLGEAVDGLTDSQLKAIKTLSKVMKPIMGAVSDFVDTIIKLVTMNVVDGYDENGKPKYKEIDIDDFDKAAVVVTTNFTTFVSSLKYSLKRMNGDVQDAIKALAKYIGPVMSGIADYVNAVINLTSLLMPDQWDKDGKPIHFTKVEDGVFENAATLISTSFRDFITALTKKFSGDFFGNKTEDALEALAGSLKPVMEGVATYVDSILKLATGQYVKYYKQDSDGKWVPIYATLTPKMFKKASDKLKDSFKTFMNAILRWATDAKFNKKAKDAMKAMGESVSPIMEAVSNFSKALEPFMKGDKELAKKDPKYLCMDSTKVYQVSLDIANAFMNFVDIIATKLTDPNNSDKFEKAVEGANNVKLVMNVVQGAINNLSKIITSMTKDGKVLENGEEIATVFSSVSLHFANDLMNNAQLYANALEGANNAKQLLNIIQSVANTYNSIIAKLTNDKKEAEVIKCIDLLTTSLNSLADNATSVYEKIGVMDLDSIRSFATLYKDVATQLVDTVNILMQAEGLTGHIEVFIKNLDILALKKTTDNMATSGNALISYTGNLLTFTAQVTITSEAVDTYTTAMKNNNDMLKKLDDALISRSKQRTKALLDFAEGVNKVSEAIDGMKESVDGMKESFNALNFDSLLEKFTAVKDLINEAVEGFKSVLSLGGTPGTKERETPKEGKKTITNAPTRESTQTITNAPIQNSSTPGHQESITQMVPGIGERPIIFQFQDTELRGWAKGM